MRFILALAAVAFAMTINPGDAEAAAFSACLKAKGKYVRGDNRNASGGWTDLRLDGTSCGAEERFRFAGTSTITDGSSVIIGYPSSSSLSTWLEDGSFMRLRVGAFAEFIIDRVGGGPGPIGNNDLVKIKISMASEADAVLETLVGNRLRWGENVENEEAETFRIIGYTAL